MIRMLALLFGRSYWRLHSWVIRRLLLWKGIDVGRGFYIEGVPQLDLETEPDNVEIGSNVKIQGPIDLRTRHDGEIVIHNDVSFDTNVRLVTARQGIIEIKEGSAIGPDTIINGGGDVRIGKKALFATNISINANDHKSSRDEFIIDQGYIHEDVIIEDDVWLGSNVCINKGVRLREGSIVGANAVVTGDTDPYSINGGVPAEKIGERT